MKRIASFALVVFISAFLSSCASSKQQQIQSLQQTQKQLSSEASINLANIDSLETKVAKYRLKATQLQQKSDALAKDVKDLSSAYAQFKDPNNDSAIAVNEELVQKTLEKAKIDEKINQYRSQANGYLAQITDLKATSQTQANQASKISQQINELKSQQK